MHELRHLAQPDDSHSQSRHMISLFEAGTLGLSSPRDQGAGHGANKNSAV